MPRGGKFVFVGCDVFVFFFFSYQRDLNLGLAFCFVIDFFIDGGMCDGRGYYLYLTKEWKEIDLVGD